MKKQVMYQNRSSTLHVPWRIRQNATANTMNRRGVCPYSLRHFVSFTVAIFARPCGQFCFCSLQY